MDRKYITLFVVIFFGLSALNFRCSKDVVPTFGHSFEAQVDIYPIKKTYALSDTIWIETDLPSKVLYDTKLNQGVIADTGNMSFGATFNEFGTYITSPSNGFCDIITGNAVNSNRELSQWATSVTVNNFSCGSANYKYRIGFKPNQKGTFHLMLPQDILFESCPNKIVPYNATISFKYKNIDLGQDIYDALSAYDKGEQNGITYIYQAIGHRRTFIFKVN